MRLFILCLLIAPVLSAGEKPIRITGPTVIAFFPAVTQDAVDKDSDLNDALDDFQWYVREAREPFAKAGVRLHEVYAQRIVVRIGRTTKTLIPGEPKVGYYFIAPGREPLVSYGVDRDEGLFDTAREYFGIAITGDPHAE